MTDTGTPHQINPHVLIAVDGSQPSMMAVKYAQQLTSVIKDMKFVLMYVLPHPPSFMADEAKTDGIMLAKYKKLQATNRERGHIILDKAKNLLIESGVDPIRIETRLKSRLSGLAKDILTEAETGKFDALVVGRRGLTRTQEFFMGSVSNQLIQHAHNIPLWLNAGQVTDARVLVAVDGSEASLRAVDHVAFMLGGNPEAVVNFLHVVPTLASYCAIDLEDHKNAWDNHNGETIEEEFRREDQVCIGDFNKKAVSLLAQAGFSQDRIRFEERGITLGVARTIIRAAKEGGYGTVVLGRRGMGKSSFLGGVSDRVIRRAEDLAVWLIN